jgi:Arc/MetJ family transcription regulator
MPGGGGDEVRAAVAEREQLASTVGLRLRQQQIELADLVAAEVARRQVVALDPDAVGAGQRLHGGDAVEQAGARENPQAREGIEQGVGPHDSRLSRGLNERTTRGV